VTANTLTGLVLRLRTERFDAAAAALWGADTPKWRVAEHLGVHRTVLSLYRTPNDKHPRQPTTDFVGRVLSTLPGDFEDYFEYVDPAARRKVTRS
jgi:hypothetical protein